MGISLEGTVDVEDGVEVRPHHYIRCCIFQNNKISENFDKFKFVLLEERYYTILSLVGTPNIRGIPLILGVSPPPPPPRRCGGGGGRGGGVAVVEVS